LDIGIIGGTGSFGRGLALRLALAGHRVWVGSRTAERAQQAVEKELAVALDAEAASRLIGASNEEAARHGEVVILSTPARTTDDLLRSLRPQLEGKVLIDCTVALDPQDPTRVPDGHTATALHTQALVGSGVRVATGFHTIAAAKLAAVDQPLEGDAFIGADDPQAKDVAMELARQMGLRAFDVGPLATGATLERMTALLIGLNKRYRRRAIGFQLTGI